MKTPTDPTGQRGQSNAAPVPPSHAKLSLPACTSRVPNIRPEWGDAKAVRAYFGICKSTLYRLADEGKVRSSSLRERGKLRGKRLFSMDGIAAYIEIRATGGVDEVSACTRG